MERSSDSERRVPECVHGPALKFRRVDTKTGDVSEFYSCSASRDRKVCPLFHWAEDWNRKQKRGDLSITASECLREKKMRFDDNLGISTLADNSTNAQFTFDDVSINTIIAILTHQIKDITAAVLCIGTPSIHKALLSAGYASVLLDEDERLSGLLPSCHRFNIYNGNWYSGRPDTVNVDFTAIIMDPPFHPKLLPALFQTVNEHFPRSFASSLILFAFPYFNKQDVESACTRLQLSDIRLTYRNHKKYKNGETSPVRLYMTLPPIWKEILIEGHKFCEACEKIVHSTNFHCETCNACTSIAGKRNFKHCSDCGICVKPDAVHCNKCSRCFISSHTCS